MGDCLKSSLCITKLIELFIFMGGIGKFKYRQFDCCEAQDGARPSPDSWRWPSSHHLDPSDLPGHGNISDRRFAAGRSLVLATNRNGGMLRLNASRHDDDDDDDECTVNFIHILCCDQSVSHTDTCKL